MKRSLALFASLLAVLFIGSCKQSEPTLSLLVWEGYADPIFVHDFEASHHCKVVASYMGSSDELVAKLRGGSAGNYDVISPSSDVATSIVKAGLAAPLDLAKIPSYPQLSSKLRESSLVKANGQVYGGGERTIENQMPVPRPFDGSLSPPRLVKAFEQSAHDGLLG